MNPRAPMKTSLIASVVLSACVGYAQSDLRFSNVRTLTNRELALTLSGGTSSLYRIEVSSNLVNWSGLATLPLTASSLQQTDTAAPYLQLRNYRALQFNDTNAL